MRLGLRSKVIILFLIAISMPIVVYSGCQYLLLNTYNKKNAGWEFTHLDLLCLDTFKQIDQDYYLLDSNYTSFDQRISPLLKNLGGQLQIIDNNGYVLYDSKDKKAVLEHKRVNIASTTGFDPMFERNNPLVYKHTYPITISNKLVASAIIIKSVKKFQNGLGAKFISYHNLSIVLGILALVLTVIFSLIYISKYILSPLKELNNAVNKISEGDLNFEVKYNGKDEFGTFCTAFEIMRKKLKDSLEKQNAYEISRKETLASITHELRTPISLISGYVEGLEVGITKNEEQYKRYLSVIKEKTLALNRLINDLLLVTQLDLGKVKMVYCMVESEDFFNKLFYMIKLQCKDKSIIFHFPEIIPNVILKIDKDRIIQVVENLIQNSLKHIKTNGEITVELKSSEEYLYVSVEDNGEGISQENLPYIFNKFYRGEKSRSRDYGGAGLGLAICKEIIEEHGGEILAKSTPNISTIITFTIPTATN